jgi:hypothetical protein
VHVLVVRTQVQKATVVSICIDLNQFMCLETTHQFARRGFNALFVVVAGVSFDSSAFRFAKRLVIGSL